MLQRLMLVVLCALALFSIVTFTSTVAEARCRFADGSYGPCPTLGR